MYLVQMTGLSGAGKSTIAQLVARELSSFGYMVEIIDGDVYRNNLCKDLGFSPDDRRENIRRLAFVASSFAKHGIIAIIAAINPYDEIRREVIEKYASVVTVHVDCDVDVLIERDSKDLYRRAMLPDDHPEKLTNLTGINDPFDVPTVLDLTINTSKARPEDSAGLLSAFLLERLKKTSINSHLPAVVDSEANERHPRAFFIGRWQPFHKGHQWLIDQKLNLGAPILIGVRDMPSDEANPLSTYQTLQLIQRVYSGKDVMVIPIPDIESINYGRGVGYEINELVPPSDVHTISATEIRKALSQGDSRWKHCVDISIHSQLAQYLS